MEYKYCENGNFEDFASGRVIYHANGIPNFPVRLVNEIYRRCLQYSNKKTDICLYDCCCGGGYSLTVLGLLNQESISEIIASDIDKNMLETANKNLSLLTSNGIINRISEISSLYQHGVTCLMESIQEICGNETIIAISMDKSQKVKNNYFKRLEKQNIGKRKFEIYKIAK